MKKNDQISFPSNVELVTAHNNYCDVTVRQVKVLRYFIFLKKYLKNPQNHLRSNLGVYLNHSISQIHPDHNSVAVSDHLLEPKDMKSTEHRLICRGCMAIAVVKIRRIATCNLISSDGVNSRRLNSKTFVFRKDDIISSFNKECNSPMYMVNIRNVMANGLVSVIPQLSELIFALKWHNLYDKYSIVSAQEIEAQLNEISTIATVLNVSANCRSKKIGILSWKHLQLHQQLYYNKNKKTSNGKTSN